MKREISGEKKIAFSRKKYMASLTYTPTYLEGVGDSEDAVYLVMADRHLTAVHVSEQSLAFIPAYILEEDDGVLVCRVSREQTLKGTYTFL